MADFTCTTRHEGTLAVVAATGDIDLAAVNQLWDKISAQITHAAVVVLDCSEISFLDSMGLQVLVRAHNHTEKEQGTFALAAVPEPVSRVLKLAGLTHLFPQFIDAATAAAAHVA